LELQKLVHGLHVIGRRSRDAPGVSDLIVMMGAGSGRGGWRLGHHAAHCESGAEGRGEASEPGGVHLVPPAVSLVSPGL